jgi:hypothetical protein
MTEKEIQLLGFEKQEFDDNSEYYYVYDITQGMSFISNSSDEVKDGHWWVEVFNTLDPIRFHSFTEVQALINKLEKAKVHEEK